MKKMCLFLLFVLVSSANLFAGTLDGVLGLKFGSSREDVRQVMLKRADFPLDKANSTNDDVLYGAGKFAGRDVEVLYLQFVNNKLYSIAFFIPVDLESRLIDTYNEIQSELNEKYYESEEIIENYKEPYEKGDGYAETAIKIGKATFLTRWKFDSSSNNEYYNMITVGITTTMQILLIYKDGALDKVASEKNKAKKLDDY
jgi:hypothetical protein